MASAQKLLLEGVSDAVCFMLGALAGYGLTLALGMDIFADGYSGSSIVGIVMSVWQAARGYTWHVSGVSARRPETPLHAKLTKPCCKHTHHRSPRTPPRHLPRPYSYTAGVCNWPRCAWRTWPGCRKPLPMVNSGSCA